MIIMAPEKIPADPRPAMARPRMKTAELGAAPQMVLPTSKMMTHNRKTLGTCQQKLALRSIISQAPGQLETYHFML